jgi:SAM-dependent methyltransferase
MAIPPGVPLAAANTLVREVLGSAARFANGSPPGWAESDPGLIRSRGAASANLVVGHLIPAVLAAMPDVIERLTLPGASFLDVGVGAAGIAIRMCQQYPELSAVGLDVSEPALAVARQDVVAAGLDDRIEIREQSVAALADVAAFDLLWLPQPFIPIDTLRQALPRLRTSARPGAVLIMALATHDESGLVGLANDLRNLMAGGGTLRLPAAAELLRTAGFTDVTPIKLSSGSIAYGRAA